MKVKKMIVAILGFALFISLIGMTTNAKTIDDNAKVRGSSYNGGQKNGVNGSMTPYGDSSNASSTLQTNGAYWVEGGVKSYNNNTKKYVDESIYSGLLKASSQLTRQVPRNMNSTIYNYYHYMLIKNSSDMSGSIIDTLKFTGLQVY